MLVIRKQNTRACCATYTCGSNATGSKAEEQMGRDMPRLAVLIDAQNAQLTNGGLLADVAKMATAIVRRVYGDFTTPTLAGRREELLACSIQPVQRFRNSVHKNTSDSALTINATDDLHSNRFDDFTKRLGCCKKLPRLINKHGRSFGPFLSLALTNHSLNFSGELKYLRSPQGDNKLEGKGVRHGRTDLRCRWEKEEYRGRQDLRKGTFHMPGSRLQWRHTD